MVQRILSINHPLNLNDVRRVVNRIKDIEIGEELVIQINNQDSYRAEGIFSVLNSEKYQWSAKGGHNGKDYYIFARRKY